MWSTPILISDHAVGISARFRDTFQVFPVRIGSELKMGAFGAGGGSSHLCGVFALKSSSETSLKDTVKKDKLQYGDSFFCQSYSFLPFSVSI